MKKNDKNKEPSKAVTYTYEALVGSNRYKEHNWAARAALAKDRRYTLEEADTAVFDYLNKPVKGVM